MPQIESRTAPGGAAIDAFSGWSGWVAIRRNSIRRNSICCLAFPVYAQVRCRMPVRRRATISLAEVPFAPRKIPFYYGWIILLLGSLGIIMSVPGQTIGVSVFTDHLIRVLGLTRVRISLAYLIGTAASALLLSPAGRIYDKHGARSTGIVVSFSLGALLIALSEIDSLNSFVKGILRVSTGKTVAFVIMALGFFLLRFLAQGVLSLVSRNMVMKWYQARRGFANAIMGVCMAFGFSYAPKFLGGMIERYSWSGTWFRQGLIIGIAFTILFAVLARDNPEECKMKPDGIGYRRRVQSRKQSDFSRGPEREITLQEARRTYTFWIYALALTLAGLYMTGLTFHIVSIFEEAGMTQSQAVGIFLPASVISVTLNFLLSWASDYMKLKYTLLFQIFGMFLSLCGFIWLAPGVSHILLIVGYGIGTGGFGVLSTVAWPRFFGLKNLGAISGFGMGWIVAGSAVGPFLFSLSLRLTGSYASSGIVCLVLAGAVLLLATKADRPVFGKEIEG